MCVDNSLCIHHGFGQWQVLVQMEDEDRSGQTLIIHLVTASVYRKLQTAAAPTLSSPCLKHKSVNTEERRANVWPRTNLTEEKNKCMGRVLGWKTQQTSALCRCLSSCCADFCLALSPLVGVEFSFGLSLRQAGSMLPEGFKFYYKRLYTTGKQFGLYVQRITTHLAKHFS